MTLSFWEIEQKLSDYYLRSDGELGASPLNFIDSSEDVLARAISANDPNDARLILLRAASPTRIREVYSTGITTTAHGETDAPGWFTYLILSCLIATTSADDSDEGDFRRRLAEHFAGGQVVGNTDGHGLYFWSMVRVMRFTKSPSEVTSGTSRIRTV